MNSGLRANTFSNIHTVILIILYKWLQTRHFQIRYQFSVPPFASWIQLIGNCKAKLIRRPIQVERENSSYQNAPGKGSIHHLNEQRTKVSLGCPILDNFEQMWIYGSSGEMIEVKVICTILLLLLSPDFHPVMEFFVRGWKSENNNNKIVQMTSTSIISNCSPEDPF